ncbi:hypothetical protein DPMN_182364 [Dreissena polymorpha]|uniref:Uncharacterized protein n=1 Tax=Dreissena polymorpha TaxID=45954 RepID=A0A9D4DEM0_DREPO|nr:hypothetical protein DPMN_182364 [Dreissena polymorpha]
MLVAVVVAFFLCWAPFHAQRLMTLYIKQWTPALIEAQEYLFYASGLLYFNDESKWDVKKENRNVYMDVFK